MHFCGIFFIYFVESQEQKLTGYVKNVMVICRNTIEEKRKFMDELQEQFSKALKGLVEKAKGKKNVIE